MIVRREIDERIAKHKKRADGHNIRADRPQIGQGSANGRARADNVVYDSHALTFYGRLQCFRKTILDRK